VIRHVVNIPLNSIRVFEAAKLSELCRGESGQWFGHVRMDFSLS
jgi:hypothetical protein